MDGIDHVTPLTHFNSSQMAQISPPQPIFISTEGRPNQMELLHRTARRKLFVEVSLGFQGAISRWLGQPNHTAQVMRVHLKFLFRQVSRQLAETFTHVSTGHQLTLHRIPMRAIQSKHKSRIKPPCHCKLHQLTRESC